MKIFMLQWVEPDYSAKKIYFKCKPSKTDLERVGVHKDCAFAIFETGNNFDTASLAIISLIEVEVIENESNT